MILDFKNDLVKYEKDAIGNFCERWANFNRYNTTFEQRDGVFKKCPDNCERTNNSRVAKIISIVICPLIGIFTLITLLIRFVNRKIICADYLDNIKVGPILFDLANNNITVPEAFSMIESLRTNKTLYHFVRKRIFEWAHLTKESFWHTQYGMGDEDISAAKRLLELRQYIDGRILALDIVESIALLKAKKGSYNELRDAYSLVYMNFYRTEEDLDLSYSHKYCEFATTRIPTTRPTADQLEEAARHYLPILKEKHGSTECIHFLAQDVSKVAADDCTAEIKSVEYVPEVKTCLEQVEEHYRRRYDSPTSLNVTPNHLLQTAEVVVKGERVN